MTLDVLPFSSVFIPKVQNNGKKRDNEELKQISKKKKESLFDFPPFCATFCILMVNVEQNETKQKETKKISKKKKRKKHKKVRESGLEKRIRR